MVHDNILMSTNHLKIQLLWGWTNQSGGTRRGRWLLLRSPDWPVPWRWSGSTDRPGRSWASGRTGSATRWSNDCRRSEPSICAAHLFRNWWLVMRRHLWTRRSTQSFLPVHLIRVTYFIYGTALPHFFNVQRFKLNFTTLPVQIIYYEF